MRIDGVCNEFVSGWDLLNTYKFVVPIGNNDFVSGWNAAFGIGFNAPFVRIPQEAIDGGIFGCKTLLLTGRELCRGVLCFEVNLFRFDELVQTRTNAKANASETNGKALETICFLLMAKMHTTLCSLCLVSPIGIQSG